MKTFDFEKVTFIVGDNAEDNWIILNSSKQSWVWFHLDNLPSPYVILEISLKKLKKSDLNWKNYINYGCSLCKEHSKFSNQKVRVMWTLCKNVSRGTKVGEAIVSGKTNIIYL